MSERLEFRLTSSLTSAANGAGSASSSSAAAGRGKRITAEPVSAGLSSSRRSEASIQAAAGFL